MQWLDFFIGGSQEDFWYPERIEFAVACFAICFCECNDEIDVGDFEPLIILVDEPRICDRDHQETVEDLSPSL